MLRQRSIAVRLLLLVLLGTGTLLAAGMIRTYAIGRQLLIQEAQDKAICHAQNCANEIEAVMRGVTKIAVELARRVQEHPPADEAEAQDLVRDVVAGNTEVYGSALAPAPGRGTGTLRDKVPYAYRFGGKIVFRDLGGVQYGYDRQEWFTRPRDRGRAIWSEPYLDVGGGEAPMVTYSVPVFTEGDPKPFWGVVTCDVTLEWLEELIRSIPVGETGYAFLVSGHGIYIVHPRREYVLHTNILDVVREIPGQDLTDLARNLLAGQTGYARIISHVTRLPSGIAYCPVPTTGWGLAVVTSEQEILAPINKLRRQELAAGVVGVVLLALIALLIARSITLPLQKLESATRVLASGDLDAPLPVAPGDDEVARLGRAFTHMRDDLKQYIADLQTTTAANERINSELQIAQAIQLSLVPKIFPPFPDRPEFELYALLHAARVIGGDFYDFFMPDHNTLCMMIGDVSGKGIPAALFMAVTRTLLHMLWREDPSPAAALARVNEEIARDNPRNMFVTLFCATIDLRSGAVRYASGGHNPPFIIRAGGEVTPVPHVKGLVVGIMEGAAFEEGRLDLGAGDSLLLYTDGLTEAMNSAEELFGTERTTAALHRLAQGPAGESVESLILGLREALGDFVQEAEQSDDIAMLGFRYRQSPASG